MTQVPTDPTDRLLLFGINHRSASGQLRDQLLDEAWDLDHLLQAFQDAGFDQGLLLFTCDRLEALLVSDQPDADRQRLLALFAKLAQSEPAAVESQCNTLQGEAALRHLFAVAASLDSQVLGEPQVLGQVKESHRNAAGLGLLSPPLEAVLQAAYGAAKRVRSETPLAERPVSIVASTLLIARSLHGDLSRCQGLLLGLGEISELLAAELSDAGLGDLVITHRSAARAGQVAQRLDCHYRPWDEREPALAAADVVVSAIGAGRYALSADDLEAALRTRRRKPILVIDTALPGDVEPAAEALDGAFIYSLDDLESVAREGRAGREVAARAAWLVVEEEIAGFRRQWAERAATPAVVRLRDHFDAVRAEILRDNNLDAEAATRLLIKRLLHEPTEALRGAAAADSKLSQDLERSLDQLFPLRQAGEGDDDGDDKA